ncbi:D-2-hydroxyacid dehydrogenase family protein [Chloroflexota bacterium]
MKIAVLDDYQGVALKMADWSVLPAGTQVTVFRDHLASADAVTNRLRDFEIVAAMRERTPFGRELLERLPNMQLLITTGMRNASIDLDAATKLGIVVCGTRGSANTTAELSWGLILALLRQVPREDTAIRQGHWQTTVGTALQGKVLGILGLGRLGSRMATIGAAFEMSVIAWSQNLTAERASQFGAVLKTKDELFASSDILSIHLQLSDRTRGLVGARELSLMKPTAYVINTSRGPIIDETALIQALQDRAIAGAGIDVFDQEPLPSEHPFKHLDNVVMTPHLGYVTKEAYQVYYAETIEDIAAYLLGHPVRVLNPSVLETPPGRRL